jgi:opacity protein-like surface antigen
VNSDADAKVFGSLALRSDVLPMLKSEIGIAYRSESRFDDLLHVRMWPITASLYVAPVPMLYAGAGVGWYPITYDYDQSKIPFAIKDETQQEFGVHLGGGMTLPLAPSAGIDLNGRYVMIRDQQSHLIPEKFSPDFWTTALGLAIKF